MYAGTAWASVTYLYKNILEQWLTSAQTLNSNHNRYQLHYYYYSDFC